MAWSLPHERALGAERPTNGPWAGGLPGTARCPTGPVRPQVALTGARRGVRLPLPAFPKVLEVGDSDRSGTPPPS